MLISTDRAPEPMNTFSDKINLISGVAELLRGDYKQSEYGRVVLPFCVLRRLDQVLAPTRDAVRDAAEKHAGKPPALRDRFLLKAAEQSFYNTSPFDFETALGDADNAAENLLKYVAGFSVNIRDLMERFRFEEQVTRLDNADLLFLVARKFVAIDLHPFWRKPDGSFELGDDGEPVPNVTNHEMGYVFEELIRKFSEQSNETADAPKRDGEIQTLAREPSAGGSRETGYRQCTRHRQTRGDQMAKEEELKQRIRKFLEAKYDSAESYLDLNSRGEVFGTIVSGSFGSFENDEARQQDLLAGLKQELPNDVGRVRLLLSLTPDEYAELDDDD